MRKVVIIAAAVLSVLVLFAGAIIAPIVISIMPFAQSSGPRPTDAEMIAHWRAQRPVLEQLAAMMREDSSLKRIGKDWTDPEDAGGLRPGRLARYRDLMRQSAILVVKQYGEQIELVYYTQGIAVSGSAKSFCFGPLPRDYVEKIDGDLDEARNKAIRERQRGYSFQRRIDGDWWLQTDGT